MPFTPDSPDGGRRNVFDVPAAVVAARAGSADSSGSIFAAPTAGSNAGGHAQSGSRKRSLAGLSRPWPVRAVALLALAGAALPLHVVFTGPGDRDTTTAREGRAPLAAGPRSAPTASSRPPGARSPRLERREHRPVHRRQRGRRSGQHRPRRRVRPPVTASAPPVAPPPPVPTTEPPAPTPPALEPAPASPPAPPSAVTPPPTSAAPALPDAPERPAPAPVPAGAPPQFM
jgi:hypothetical protein